MSRDDKKDPLSPGSTLHPNACFTLMEGVPEDKPTSRTPTNRRMSTASGSSGRSRRMSVSPIKISDQLPPQRRQSFRLPENKMFLRQNSEDSRIKVMVHSPDKSVVNVQTPERSEIKIQTPEKAAQGYTPVSLEDQFSPERGREEVKSVASEHDTPQVGSPPGRGQDVHTLLPPIEKHASDKCLDQVDNFSMPQKRSSYKARRHTVCSSSSTPIVITSLREGHSVLQRSKLDEIVNLNCSGELYQVKRKILVKYPNTLLGSPDLEHFYHPQLQAYFFDRNRQFFEHIMQFYLCGRLNIASSFDWAVARTELIFFRISDDEVLEEWDLTTESNVSQQGKSESSHTPTTSQMELYREQLFVFLNDPKHSLLALGYCLLDVVLVCLAMMLMMLETDSKLMPGANIEGTRDHNLIYISDKVFMGFFSLDIVLRILSWPRLSTCSYLKEPMNIVDIVAITPYYVQHIVSMTSVPPEVDVVAVLRATRLLRMVRIFRFVRHSDELFQIIRFVYETRNQLCIIYVFSHMIILMFGATMFYAEGPPHFESILSSCWWSLVTLSTLGYGDKVPTTVLGCVVGSAAVMVGMVILSLPMTIVVSRFAEWYETEKKYEQANKRNFKTVSPTTSPS